MSEYGLKFNLRNYSVITVPSWKLKPVCYWSYFDSFHTLQLFQGHLKSLSREKTHHHRSSTNLNQLKAFLSQHSLPGFRIYQKFYKWTWSRWLLLKSDTQPAAVSVHSFQSICLCSANTGTVLLKWLDSPTLYLLQMRRKKGGGGEGIIKRCQSKQEKQQRENKMKGDGSCPGGNTHDTVCIFACGASGTDILRSCILLPHSQCYTAPHPNTC